MRRNTRGFTLMELMVVIVIVAILAAVAVPLYINYVRDAQRTEAKGAIGAIISAEQVEFQKHGQYLTTGLDNAGSIEDALGIDLTDSKNNWDFAITASGAATNGFKVTATGKTGKPSKDLAVEFTQSRDGTGIPATGPWNDNPTPSTPPPTTP
jgi:prepilin-type N-terminal cleavage/methylation domain-containing protein